MSALDFSTHFSNEGLLGEPFRSLVSWALIQLINIPIMKWYIYIYTYIQYITYMHSICIHILANSILKPCRVGIIIIILQVLNQAQKIIQLNWLHAHSHYEIPMVWVLLVTKSQLNACTTNVTPWLYNLAPNYSLIFRGHQMFHVCISYLSVMNWRQGW
jgi:hypothetical protein